MATAQVVRPAQASRIRRDGPARQGVVKRLDVASDTAQGLGAVSVDGGEPASKRRKVETEPYTRSTAHILHKHRGKPVSMTVHLHQNYFRFENQEGSFAYDSPMRFIIEHLRKRSIPHEIVEELLAQRVPFYDGCLIVEIHNHRQGTGKDRTRPDATAGDHAKFSMNNYTNYITPSPFVPFPSRPKADDIYAKSISLNPSSDGKATTEQESAGPHVSTVVLHPTSLSRHKELGLLARTKKADLMAGNVQVGATTAQTSGAKASPGVQDKMVVTPQNMYEFEASLLLHSEPPLYLAPVKNPQEAQMVLELLSDPLHAESPPSPKTRKKTTAQMAADDAQAAELQRRMLIMDERIKPSVGAGVATGESQGAAASLGISRFKTIQMAKEKIAEQEVAKKAEETQAATKRREQEQAQAELLRAEQARQAAEIQRKELLAQRSEQARRHAVLQAQQQAQQAAQQAKQAQLQALQQAQINSAHNQAQHSNLMNQQQSNLQHANNMARNSPVVRNQTPMVNSSPMLPQGFPVANTNQGAGSPPRPPSAAMPNPMVRQSSHQTIISHQNTPQMAQGIPNLSGQVMANRALSQTPRMAQASPAPGTPGQTGGMPNMVAGNGLNAEQMFMLQQQQQQRAQLANRLAMQGASLPDATATQMTPQQVQMAMNARNQQILIQQARDSSNPTLQAKARGIINQMQQTQQANMARMQQQNAQNAISGQMAASHQGMQVPQQASPGMQGHTPDQLTAMRRQHLQEGMKQVQALMSQYGSVQSIPPNLLTQQARMYITHQRAQQQARAVQMSRQAQLAQGNAQAGMNGGGGGGNAEYMQQLQQQQQAMILAAQQNGGHMGNVGMQGMGMQGMGMGMGMGANGMQQFGANAQNDFNQQYANMQNAMNQRQQGGMQ